MAGPIPPTAPAARLPAVAASPAIPSVVAVGPNIVTDRLLPRWLMTKPRFLDFAVSERKLSLRYREGAADQELRRNMAKYAQAPRTRKGMQHVVWHETDCSHLYRRAQTAMRVFG